MDHNQGQSGSNRPPARRGPSGAWNRLKPVTVDPLEAYGLPSKGDNRYETDADADFEEAEEAEPQDDLMADEMTERLHDHKIQEAYYTKIVERYMKFCAASSGAEELEAAFASLTIAKQPGSIIAPQPSSSARPPMMPHHPSATDRPNDLPNILMAMRRLREGILGSRRRDAFAQRAYMFIAQACILTRQWESYQPTLLHLVHYIHPHTPLSPLELRDYVGYLILDLACRQNELMQAYELRLEFAHNDRHVNAVLKALVHDDWPLFWRVRRAVDGYQRALMGFAEDRVRLHALKCIGRSYMSADKAFIERAADAKWEDLVVGGVGWQLQENGTVIIRKPKAKPT